MTKPRCVVDTNVFISAALSKRSNPRKIIDFIGSSGILLASQATFEEFETRVRRQKFDKYFVDPLERESYIDWIYSLSYPFIETTHTIVACADADDDKFLEVAVSGRANYLITGNLKDFPPSPFQDVVIIQPAFFAQLVLR